MEVDITRETQPSEELLRHCDPECTHNTICEPASDSDVIGTDTGQWRASEKRYKYRSLKARIISFLVRTYTRDSTRDSNIHKEGYTRTYDL